MTNLEHKPVLLAEVLSALQPQVEGRYVDGTLGRAGHAKAILAASSPSGFLFGCDRDGDALEAAKDRLKEFAGRFELRQGNFDEVGNWVELGSCDGALLDLGVSSPQLDLAERGFSFLHDGPLDMRMDRRQDLTAAEIVNETKAEDLADIFWRYGDERESRKMARAIERERQLRAITTTRQLAELVEKISPRAGKKTHPATKVFQALRIAVNDEIGSLKRGLDGILTVLKPGGKLAIITFHSLEDRVVKEWSRRLARDYEVIGEVDVPELRKPAQPALRILTRKPIKPTDTEQRQNPRSRSSQLRVFEKL